MEERKKYVCKYCSKRFPCGKSLGGHIRTHIMTEERSNDVVVVDGDDNDNMFIKLDGTVMRNNKDSLWCEDNNNPIYGLRENPKKTMRFVHSGGGANANNNEQQNKEDKRFCKECGKGFPSLKALCGHMACHSEKEKRTTTTIKFEEEKLVMDSHSDTETCVPTTHPRRSKRMRVKKTINLSNHNPFFSFSSPPSSSGVIPLANGSSPVSEVEQEEQEEVARCLVLLSRDSGVNFKGGRFASVTESSDNNSVILEAKLSSPDTQIGVSNGSNNNNNNFVSNNHAYDLVAKKLLKVKDIKFKSAEFAAADNYSGSRLYRYRPKTKMVDSDFSNDEFKWSQVEGKSSKYTASVVKKLVMEDLDYDTTNGTIRKFDSRKRSNYDLVGVSSMKIANGFGNEVNENGTKGWKCDCFEGERDNGFYDSIDDESNENSSETESFPAPRSHHKSKALNGKKCTKAKKKKLKPSKKSKDHECPICYKIFKSGQALGGHKRSHFIGGSEENTMVIKQVPYFIDLNLPAPVDE